SNDPNDFYFIIASHDGKELARSTNAPASKILPENDGAFHPGELRPRPGANPPQPPLLRSAGTLREMVHLLPSGEAISVGCSIAPELKELRLTALKLAGVGGVILFLGLAGGGWLVSRALRPVSEIGATATKISAGDLSQRINAADTESELGQLAAVLNSTFA